MIDQLSPETLAFYRRAMTLLDAAGVPFLVGGAYAFERYTGIARHTKDFDIFVHPRDFERVLATLAEAGRPLSAGVLETHVDLSRGRLESMLKVLDVDGAVRRVGGGWTATGQPWHYDAERYERVAAERTREQEAMLAYLATDGCRMEYLRRQLDDPAAVACGRCDNCTGQRVGGEVPETSVTAARERLLRPGVTVEPRRMWPTGMKALGVDAAGKIPSDLTAEPGRALGRLTDIGWGANWTEAAPEGHHALRTPAGAALAREPACVVAPPAATPAVPGRDRRAQRRVLARRRTRAEDWPAGHGHHLFRE